MNTQAKIDAQVQLWSLLGPFFTVLTIFLSFVKPTSFQWVFPTSALLGIFFCWKWKWRGLFLALFFLLGLCIFYYNRIPVADRFWFSGLAMALGSSFLVSFLSFEEASELVHILQSESKGRLDHVLQMDEQIKKTHQGFHREKTLLFNEISRLKQEIQATSKLQDEYQKAVAELKSTKEQHRQSLSNALNEHQEKIAKIKEEYAALKTNESLFVDQLEKLRLEIKELKEANQLLSVKIEQAETERQMHQDALQEVNAYVQTVSDEKKELEIALSQAQNHHAQLLLEEKKGFESTIAQLNQQHLMSLANEKRMGEASLMKAQHQHLQTLSAERKALENSLAQLQNQYDQLQQQQTQVPVEIQSPEQLQSDRFEPLYLQLREQFEEKSAHLDQARRELFLTQEKLLQMELEWKETHDYGRTELECELERLLIKSEEELSKQTQEIESLEILLSQTWVR